MSDARQETVAACRQPVTDCHGLNAAAMREALEAAIPIMRACIFDYYNTTGVNKVVGEMKAALSAPPRNCDVGTAEEQNNRFLKFCESLDCERYCPLFKAESCELAWAQMPYEEGSGK